MKVKIGSRVFSIKDCRGIRSVKGLMFDNMDKYDGALIYANNIWMPFVKHELDLLFLDKNFNLIETQHAVPMTLNPFTWKIYSCKRAVYCLELKRGMIKTKNKKPKIKFLK